MPNCVSYVYINCSKITAPFHIESCFINPCRWQKSEVSRAPSRTLSIACRHLITQVSDLDFEVEFIV